LNESLSATVNVFMLTPCFFPKVYECIKSLTQEIKEELFSEFDFDHALRHDKSHINYLIDLSIN